MAVDLSSLDLAKSSVPLLRLSTLRLELAAYASAMSELAGETAADQLDRGATPTTPTAVVERFLELLAAADLDGALQLVAKDIEYTNVSLPTVHGRERMRRVFGAGYERGGGFEVYVHAISADGPTVLTERTDVLKFGSLRVQLWVCGRFDVRGGEIVKWRDYFDWLNVAGAVVRGLLGTVIPSVRASPPSVR
jgi:limonene-1,2-epoxide hydrolase